jgi:hypothetical protein
VKIVKNERDPPLLTGKLLKNFKWINYVESILNRAGLEYIFINQVGYCDKTYLNPILKELLNFVSQVYTNMKSYEVSLEFPKEIYLIPYKQ